MERLSIAGVAASLGLTAGLLWMFSSRSRSRHAESEDKSQTKETRKISDDGDSEKMQENVFSCSLSEGGRQSCRFPWLSKEDQENILQSVVENPDIIEMVQKKVQDRFDSFAAAQIERISGSHKILRIPCMTLFITHGTKTVLCREFILSKRTMDDVSDRFGVSFVDPFEENEGVGKKKAKLSSHSVFCIGSVTKMFTSLMLAQMCDKGWISLHRPLCSVRGFESFSLEGCEDLGQGITLIDLAGHVAAMPREAPQPAHTTEEVLALMKSRKMRSIGPRRFYPSYSNLAFSLLGRALGSVCGLTYEEWIDKHLLQGMGMSCSGFEVPSNGFVRPMVPGSGPNDLHWSRPSGGMVSTSVDLAQFGKFLSTSSKDWSSYANEKEKEKEKDKEGKKKPKRVSPLSSVSAKDSIFVMSDAMKSLFLTPGTIFDTGDAGIGLFGFELQRYLDTFWLYSKCGNWSGESAAISVLPAVGSGMSTGCMLNMDAGSTYDATSFVSVVWDVILKETIHQARESDRRFGVRKHDNPAVFCGKYPFMDSYLEVKIAEDGYLEVFCKPFDVTVFISWEPERDVNGFRMVCLDDSPPMFKTLLGTGNFIIFRFEGEDMERASALMLPDTTGMEIWFERLEE
eukprot:TRINITY_DN720_c0_g1_i4.p1 TRINITY_DN720_c0_g1~~TRINITY_DN720_c0_g1_i4.p1  ORF type:complete len:662 (-),score=164.34 TRINITY_DN720_c0_g1_i4:1126-3006(-)